MQIRREALHSFKEKVPPSSGVQLPAVGSPSSVKRLAGIDKILEISANTETGGIESRRLFLVYYAP